jgi:hypothetical protein
MKLGRFRRRTVAALVVAYAVALQALLSAFVPMATVAPPGLFAVICSHDGGDGSGPPAQHDLPCAALCAAMAQGLSGPLPPTVTVAIIAPQVVSSVAPASDWVPPGIAFAPNHAPRGPPLA